MWKNQASKEREKKDDESSHARQLITMLEIMCQPLEDEGKRGDDGGGEGVAVDNQHVVAHAMVQRDLGDDVHASISELQRDHGEVGFGAL